MAIVSMSYAEMNPKSADQITYENTESGLEATNVQDAIDEVNAARIYIKTFPQVTINSSTTTSARIDTALGGYTTIGYRIQNASQLAMEAVKVGKDGNLYVIYTGQTALVADVYVYYVKTSELIELP